VAAEARVGTILVVDDEPAIRELLVAVLGDEGHTVLAAADGDAAWALLTQPPAGVRRPDLVVTDVMMPKLDGLRLLRRIRANPALAGTPVLLLTAARPPNLAGENGVSFLPKPFDLDAVLAAVASAVGG
jgi:CheY-like chemotaxis protein